LTPMQRLADVYEIFKYFHRFAITKTSIKFQF
jgi:hypothetical protein